MHDIDARQDVGALGRLRERIVGQGNTRIDPSQVQ
jgi:hypothetical protein